MIKLLNLILPLVAIIVFIVFVFGPGVVNSETFEGYPRTPDTIEGCPLHAEYIYRIMLLRAEGVTEEEVLLKEKTRWENFMVTQQNADPAYWAWSEYAIAEAYKASDHVMGSNERMVHYALRYFSECVRIKQEEAGS